MHIWFTRASVTAGTVAAVGLLAAGTASAHVTANSPDATQEWDEPPKADGSEPEHPVPTVQLAAAGATAATHGVSATAASAPAPSTSTSDNTARWLGGAGLVLGALGLALGGGLALRSRGRS